MIIRVLRRLKRIPRWQWSLTLIPYKLLCALIFLPDPSIAIVWKLGIVPYGIPWMIINLPSKFWLDLWPFYMLALDIPITALAWKYLPSRPLIVFIYVNLWAWIDDYSNMSVFWLSQFGVLNPGFTVLSVLTKIPTPGTPGWDYAFQPFHFVVGGNTRIIKYGLIVFTWIYGPSEWLYRRLRK